MREIGENIQMLKKDSNFHFLFCSVFIWPGLAEASGAICIASSSGKYLKSSTKLFSLK